MEEDDDKNRLKTVLQKLEEKLKEPKNFWIFDELRRIVDNCDIVGIRCGLNIRGAQSIDYSFVEDPVIHNELIIDNVCMENFTHEVETETEKVRFYGFCQNACSQAKCIVNYYLVKRFGNTPELLSYAEEMSDNMYKHDEKHKVVEDIPLSNKLYAVCHDLLTTDDSKWFSNLLEVCNDKSNMAVAGFIAKESFESIRTRLLKLVAAIKLHIESGFKAKEQDRSGIQAIIHSNNKEKTLSLLEEKLKASKNFWILDALRRIVDNCDISDICRVVNIKREQSIDYMFVDDGTVRNQLVIDNLHMENCAFDVQTKTGRARFIDFCQYAFFQVEGIINYYYVKRFGNTTKLLSYIEVKSNGRYKRKNDNDTVELIPIANKIYVICHDLLTTDDSTWFGDLRKIRNYRAHRSSNADGDEIKKINDFLAKENFSSVRTRLQKLIAAIKSHIESDFNASFKIGTITEKFAYQTNIEIDGKSYRTEQILKGIEKGDKIKIFDFKPMGNSGKCKLIKYEKL